MLLRGHRSSRHSYQYLSIGAIGILPVALILFFLASVAWFSVHTGVGTANSSFGLDGYSILFADPTIVRALLNTAIFIVVTVLVAAAFGIPAAWLVGRTNLPGTDAVRTLMTFGVIFPGFLIAMGWMFLLSPRTGLLNSGLRLIPGLESVELSVANAPGMGFVQGLSLAPLFFVMLADAVRLTDPVLEEAGTVHGISSGRVFWRVTLPLMSPSILAAAVYTTTVAVAVFDVPAIIGLSSRVFTVSTYLYDKVRPTQGAPAYNVAGAFSILLIVATLPLMWSYLRLIRRSYRYAVMTGKGFRPEPLRLSRRGKLLAWIFLGTYFLMAQLLPILSTLWISLLPFAQPFSAEALQQISLGRYASIPWSLFLNGLRNTLVLIAVAPLLSLFFSFVVSWIVVRSRFRWKYLLDIGAFLPLVIPGIVFALGMLLVSLFVLRTVIPLYGTIGAMLVVYVLQHMSFGTRNINGALIGIHRELEETAQVHSISLVRRLAKVVIPLLTPTLVSTWLWLALLTYRELTVATFLSSTTSITLPVVIWSAWQSGIGQSAAEAILAFVVMVPLVALYWFVTRRFLFPPLGMNNGRH